MDIRIIILILALAALAVILVVLLAVQQAFRSRRSRKLQEKYGSEYDYTMQKEGDKRAAEAALLEREQRIKELDIQALNPDRSAQYQSEWDEIQAGFVDQPAHALDNADKLITEVMVARGFPVEDFEQRAADLSVLYPEYVNDYRNAHEMTLAAQKDGGASTEDLRHALISDRAVFEALVESDGAKDEVVVKAQDKTPENVQAN